MKDSDLIVDGINLTEAGVIYRGTFDGKGYPTGWHVNGSKIKAAILTTENTENKEDCVMYIDNSEEDFKIYIRGIFSPTLSEESASAKKIKTTSN